jgi:small subunit ribosomal protein S20
VPILRNAKKALRQSQRRALANQRVKLNLKQAVRAVRDTKDTKHLPAAYQAIDRAVKKHLIHQNKAAHLKSQLVKFLKTNSVLPKTAKKAVKKSPAKKITPKRSAKSKSKAPTAHA